MSAPEATLPETREQRATIEILWQDDVAALVFERGEDGSVSAGGLTLGSPAFGELASLPKGSTARNVPLAELLEFGEHLDDDVELGGSARGRTRDPRACCHDR